MQTPVQTHGRKRGWSVADEGCIQQTLCKTTLELYVPVYKLISVQAVVKLHLS